MPGGSSRAMCSATSAGLRWRHCPRADHDAADSACPRGRSGRYSDRHRAGNAHRAHLLRPPMTPRLTIVTACYNHAEYLPECIASVGRQTVYDIEHIIVIDGATDDSE